VGGSAIRRELANRGPLGHVCLGDDALSSVQARELAAALLEAAAEVDRWGEAMTRIVIAPAEKDAKLTERDGQLLLYIGRVTMIDDTFTVVPCRGITDRNPQTLRDAPDWSRRTRPEEWRRGPDGWTTHVLVDIDVDETIARALEAADEGDRRSDR
jgi:hypothetical protein